MSVGIGRLQFYDTAFSKYYEKWYSNIKWLKKLSGVLTSSVVCCSLGSIPILVRPILGNFVPLFSENSQKIKGYIVGLHNHEPQ